MYVYLNKVYSNYCPVSTLLGWTVRRCSAISPYSVIVSDTLLHCHVFLRIGHYAALLTYYHTTTLAYCFVSLDFFIYITTISYCCTIAVMVSTLMFFSCFAFLEPNEQMFILFHGSVFLLLHCKFIVLSHWFSYGIVILPRYYIAEKSCCYAVLSHDTAIRVYGYTVIPWYKCTGSYTLTCGTTTKMPLCYCITMFCNHIVNAAELQYS